MFLTGLEIIWFCYTYSGIDDWVKLTNGKKNTICKDVFKIKGFDLAYGRFLTENTYFKVN